MEIWETNLTGKEICLYFPRWSQQTHVASSPKDSTQGGTPAFKMEMKQDPQEEEIPMWAMVALKISRKHCPQRHQPCDLPTWGQMKTLTNQAENLVSQQGMPQNPENLLIAVLTCATLLKPDSQIRLNWAYLPNPPLLQVIKWMEKRRIKHINQ